MLVGGSDSTKASIIRVTAEPHGDRRAPRGVHIMHLKKEQVPTYPLFPIEKPSIEFGGQMS